MNDEANGTGRWLSAQEAAEYVGLSRDTLYRKAQEGKIPFGKTDGGHYRFHTNALDEYLRKNASS